MVKSVKCHLDSNTLRDIINETKPDCYSATETEGEDEDKECGQKSDQ